MCLPAIVNEFTKQARGVSIFTREDEPECDELMFSDTLESDLSRSFGGMERLDMFFPFDPILLTKSDRLAENNSFSVLYCFNFHILCFFLIVSMHLKVYPASLRVLVVCEAHIHFR